MEKPDLSGAKFQTFLRSDHARLDKYERLYFEAWVCPIDPKPTIRLKEAQLIHDGVLPDTQLA